MSVRLSNCPECDSPLYRSAASCKCGWGKTKEAKPERQEVPRVSCGYPGCTTPAICKVRIGKQNWLHACDPHYVWAGERHLDYLLASRPPRPREPGSDDEEVAA